MVEASQPATVVRAWRPAVEGVSEVFHARFVDHAYPSHTHDTWTLLIVDDGAVRYDLDRHEHGALGATVTLLPPQVSHDGRAVGSGGFRKRVVYLDDPFPGTDLIGAAVDRPTLDDPALRRQIDLLHADLRRPGEEHAARGRLLLVADRLHAHLTGAEPSATPVRHRELAHRLRDLLDTAFPADPGLDAAAAALHAHPTHLVRAFRSEFGLPPHRYVVGRRVDLARRLLLDGIPGVVVAERAGFHDQPHLTRHFRRLLGTTPGRFARPGGG